MNETYDERKNGVSEVLRLEGKKPFGNGGVSKGGQLSKKSKWVGSVSKEPLGGPTSTGKPSLPRTKFLNKKVGLGFSKKVGRWVVFVRPKRNKGFKKGLAQVSLLRLPLSETGDFTMELPKSISAAEVLL